MPRFSYDKVAYFIKEDFLYFLVSIVATLVALKAIKVLFFGGKIFEGTVF